ncbi:MAG: energy transducer TonB [Proteobacteria bacterium]|nr:MAG: energy transducer TonB [Pseudomonadota bacterium]
MAMSKLPLKTLSMVVVSALAHVALVFAALLIPQSKSPLPIGVNRRGDATLIELGSSTPSKKTAPRVSRNADDIVVKTESPAKKIDEDEQKRVAQTSTTQTDAQFGSATGTADSGALGVANGSEVSERERYLYELHRLIDGRKVYPSLAKRMRQTGKVLVQFEILKDGEIQNVIIKSPSSHERLNEAASQLIAGIKHYRPLPKSAGSDRLSVTVPVDYSIY